MKTFVDHLRIIGSALIERRKLIFVLCAFLFAIGIFEGVWCGYFTYPVSVTGAIVYIVIYALLACFSLSSILLIFFTENKGKGFWKEATYAVFFAFFAIFMMVFAILASYLEAAYNDARPLAYFVVAAAVPLIVLTHPTATFVLQLGGVISLAFALQSIPEAEFSWTNFLGAMVFAGVMCVAGYAVYANCKAHYVGYNQLRKESLIDELTGLGNRRSLDKQIAHVSTLGSAYCFAVCDVDHFKTVNDEKGHGYGDEALKIVAETLRRYFQHSYRWGGDEFAVITRLPKEETLYRLAMVKENLAKHGLSLCVGLYCADPGEEGLTAFRHADEALLKAKGQKEGTVQVY